MTAFQIGLSLFCILERTCHKVCVSVQVCVCFVVKSSKCCCLSVTNWKRTGEPLPKHHVTVVSLPQSFTPSFCCSCGIIELSVMSLCLLGSLSPDPDGWTQRVIYMEKSRTKGEFHIGTLSCIPLFLSQAHQSEKSNQHWTPNMKCLQNVPTHTHIHTET